MFRKKESNVVADVSFLLLIPPCLINNVVETFSNTETEIVALCHAIVQIHQLVVIANDVNVEVINAHSVNYLSSIG